MQECERYTSWGRLRNQDEMPCSWDDFYSSSWNDQVGSWDAWAGIQRWVLLCWDQLEGSWICMLFKGKELERSPVKKRARGLKPEVCHAKREEGIRGNNQRDWEGQVWEGNRQRRKPSMESTWRRKEALMCQTLPVVQGGPETLYACRTGHLSRPLDPTIQSPQDRA